MKVPFVDLKTQYHALAGEILPAVTDVMENTAFILGRGVETFEKDFAAYLGATKCVSVASGTDALYAAMRALSIGPGDDVLLPTNTFIATAVAVSQAGARPVFVDMRPDTYNIDVEQLAARLTPNTRAVIPVHLYGQAADMDGVLAFAEKHGLDVVEDACQAHGAVYKGRKCGTIGTMGCFSFYPGKNLGAYGDGGAVTTMDEGMAEKLLLLRNYGQKEKGRHIVLGGNSRLDGIQAAVLNVKLKYLQEWTQARVRNAGLYAEHLTGIDEVTTPAFDKNAEFSHVFHLYVIRAERRDELIDFLKEREIFCGIHYPVPIHLTGAYEDLGYTNGDFPNAEAAAQEIVSLPMYAELTEEQIRAVAEAIKQFYAG